MSFKKTVFSNSWLTLENYATWLHAVPTDKHLAGCRLCNTTFSLSNMGKQALTSHRKSKKHLHAEKRLKSCPSVKDFDVTAISSNKSSQSIAQSAPLNAEIETGTSSGALSQTDIAKKFLLAESVTKAEITWCLHIAVEHMSFRVAERTMSTIKMMCPDSSIADKMQMHRTKIAYTIVHGIAPYFRRKLLSKLKEVKYLVVGFDESLNKVSQKKQMDVILRFWDTEKKEVSSRYLTSVFLGHSCASDILQGFKSALAEINLKRIIQVSMDGPNVNLKFLKDLRTELVTSPEDPAILDIGSCGIHTLHCAFKAALNATEWDISTYLRGLYDLFKNVPARRADYIQYSGSSLFPKKFCGIRWGENVVVAKRAIEIHSYVQQYIASVEAEKTPPSCKSYKTVVSFTKDSLVLPKLSFFQMMAEIIEPYTKEFQGEAPLSPFLYETLSSMIRSILTRFIKADIMRNASSLTNIDVFNKNNLKNSKDVDVGYAVRAALKKAKSSASNLDHFYKSALLAFQTFVKKICERSPLKFKLTRGISCLDPEIVKNPTIAEKRLSSCLEILVTNKWLLGSQADKIDSQYKSLIKKQSVIEAVKSYDRSSCRLDKFWMQIIDLNNGFDELKDFVQLILIFSHGNAFVERGFSVNAECLIENQSEESLIALREIHDAVTSAGGISFIEIDKSMVHAARNAYSFYKESLEDRKKRETQEQKAESEKKNAVKTMKELQAKKMKLLAETEKEISLINEEIESIKKKA